MSLNFVSESNTPTYECNKIYLESVTDDDV